MGKRNQIIAAVVALVPEYLANPDDCNISGGNWAICIIDEDNNVSGKFFGNDKVQGRQSFKIAWIKASQSWITGYKTGEYEKLVYSGIVDDGQFGIQKPDFLGWEGGQVVTLKDGTKFGVGFSGFRGTSDIEIVERAIVNSDL
jgi:glc operon protein GlcG